MIELSYDLLLSPYSLYIEGIGNVKSYKLKEIYSPNITKKVYDVFLSTIITTPERYCLKINKDEKQFYEEISDEEKESLTMYDFIIDNSILQLQYSQALEFFLEEYVLWDDINKVFITYKSDEPLDSIEILLKDTSKIIGIINRDNLCTVCDVIKQRNGLSDSKKEDYYDESKAKNKAALDIIKKIKAGRKKTQELKKGKQQEESDPKFDFGNIISAVASNSFTLNLSNIWELTVFQLYDHFKRMQINTAFYRNTLSVSVWGDSENKYDDCLWYTNFRQ